MDQTDSNDTRPKQQKRIETEERLMKAGLKLFSKLGFDATTTKMISNEAQVNEALIIRYFGSKEGLFSTLVQQFIQETHQRELVYPPRETLEEELRSYFFEQKSAVEIKYDFLRIVLSKAWLDPSFLRKEMEKNPFRGDPRLISRLERLRSRGNIRHDVDLRTLDFTIMFQGFSAIFLGSRILGHSDEECDASLSLFAKAMARGLLP